MSRYDDERREYEADVFYEAWRRGRCNAPVPMTCPCYAERAAKDSK